MGPVAILAASSSFAAALLLLSKCGEEHPLIVSRNVLGLATAQILLLSFFMEEPLPSAITLHSLFAILYLGVMCAGIVYLLYMSLIRESGPLFASLTNYLVPTFGVFIGYIFSSENIGINTWIALVLILLAVAINQTKTARKKVNREVQA